MHMYGSAQEAHVHERAHVLHLVVSARLFVGARGQRQPLFLLLGFAPLLPRFVTL